MKLLPKELNNKGLSFLFLSKKFCVNACNILCMKTFTLLSSFNGYVLINQINLISFTAAYCLLIRSAMKKLITITILWILAWFMSLSPAWAEPYDKGVGAELRPSCLSEQALDDAALAEISGQGAKVSIQEGQEGRAPKIILWDEAESRMTGINLSTGNGNSQSNVLSILGGKF
jgi:hypothetical protein